MNKPRSLTFRRNVVRRHLFVLRAYRTAAHDFPVPDNPEMHSKHIAMLTDSLLDAWDVYRYTQQDRSMYRRGLLPLSLCRWYGGEGAKQ